MRRCLPRIWESVTTGFWSMPTAIVIASAMAAQALIALDHQLAGDGITWPIWFSGGVEGSRAVLSAIASSSITVLGVIFSVTIVALTLASQQYGPRVLRSFLRDRGSQGVMGILTGLHVFALLLLRTVTVSDGKPFVPEIAINVAIAYALAGVGAIIYFIHHISVDIQAARIVADIAAEVSPLLHRRFPDDAGAPTDPSPGTDAGDPVTTGSAGYVTAIDGDALIGIARASAGRIRLLHRPGDFALAAQPLALVEPAGRLDDRMRDRIRDAVSIDRQRIVRQDVGFGLTLIADMAVKAVSSSINDPTTALLCLDRLAELLAMAVSAPDPVSHRADDEGQVRLIAPPLDVAGLLATAFDSLRHHGGEDPLVATAALAALRRLADLARAEHLPAIGAQAARFAAVAAAAGFEPQQRRAVEELVQAIDRRCREAAAG